MHSDDLYLCTNFSSISHIAKQAPLRHFSIDVSDFLIAHQTLLCRLRFSQLALRTLPAAPFPPIFARRTSHAAHLQSHLSDRTSPATRRPLTLDYRTSATAPFSHLSRTSAVSPPPLRRRASIHCGAEHLCAECSRTCPA